MKREFPKYAYLECDYLGDHPFYGYVLEFQNIQGNIIGFTYFSRPGKGRELVRKIDDKRALAKIIVDQETSEGIFMRINQSSPVVIGNPQTHNQIVNRTQIIYKEEMKNPN